MEQSSDYLRIKKAIEYLGRNYQNQPSLDEVSSYVGLSRFHFQRLFTRWAGVSPKLFTQFLTVNHAKKLLAEGQSTLTTSYDVGLSSTGRLHDLFVKIEAMTPGEFKNKGKNIEVTYGFYQTLFGDVLIAETQKGVCHLSFVTNKHKALKDLKHAWQGASFIEATAKNAKKVQAVLNGKNAPKGEISLNIRATDFQIKVWEALLKIPQGKLCTYADVARSIGKPKAARAVGTAVGQNEIAYLIPCHRVIRESGVIGQYRWGSAQKSVLIGWDFAQCNRV